MTKESETRVRARRSKREAGRREREEREKRERESWFHGEVSVDSGDGLWATGRQVRRKRGKREEFEFQPVAKGLFG
jgi:hypothetical protein